MKNNLRNMTGGVLVMLLALAPFAPAAEEEAKADKSHQMTGVIVSVDAKSVEIKNREGQTSKFAINEGTKFGTKSEPKTAADFKVNDKIVVTYEKEGMVAKTIRVPKAKPAEAPAK